MTRERLRGTLQCFVDVGLGVGEADEPEAAFDGADATRHDDAANTLCVLAVALETGAVEGAFYVAPVPAMLPRHHTGSHTTPFAW